MESKQTGWAMELIRMETHCQIIILDIWVRLPDDTQFTLTEPLNSIGIKTGSGGGSWKGLSYSYTMFLDDWPKFACQHTLALLAGNIDRAKFVYTPELIGDY